MGDLPKEVKLEDGEESGQLSIRRTVVTLWELILTSKGCPCLFVPCLKGYDRRRNADEAKGAPWGQKGFIHVKLHLGEKWRPHRYRVDYEFNFEALSESKREKHEW